MLHLIKMWLEAPVEETDERGNKHRSTRNRDEGRGTPQGSPISPLFSNLYMRRFVLGWRKLGHEERWKACIVNYADDLVICCRVGAEQALAEMRAMMSKLKLTVNDGAPKQKSALLIALADVGGVWDLTATTEALTRFADAAVRRCAALPVARYAREGRLNLDPDCAAIEAGCGLVALALGKHGAHGLNYSSDIDIIVLYDLQRRLDLPHGVEPSPLFERLTKALARLLQERTPDGYVFRVDLRLRPDPGSTPIALSIASASAYYETLGQNWERAAMIKARPAAGDLELGRRFLADLAPFIWRKYFDYAAIADIHAMKRQIHAVRGHERVTVPGHDVKLGRGGIREIEFFVQTQQLIFGGRRASMRGARTLDMLRQLHAEQLGRAPRRSPTSTERLCVPAPRRASPADGRRRADAAPAFRDRPRWRASPNSAATRGSTASPPN